MRRLALCVQTLEGAKYLPHTKVSPLLGVEDDMREEI